MIATMTWAATLLRLRVGSYKDDMIMPLTLTMMMMSDGGWSK